MFQNILVPTDGSEATFRAVTVVAKLASQSKDVKVTLVLAIAPIARRETDLDERVVARQNEAMRREASQELERTLEIFTSQGIQPVTKILEGEPASVAIAREAEAEPYDLIAIGSLGLGMDREDSHYVGSVADRLIRQVSLPVLVVPIHTDSSAIRLEEDSLIAA